MVGPSPGGNNGGPIVGFGVDQLVEHRVAGQAQHIVDAVGLAPRRPLPAELVWVSLAELATLTLSGPHRRWVTEIAAKRNP